MAELKPFTKDERGQAVVEYILILAVITGFFVLVTRALRDEKIASAVLKPLTEEHARAYQFGHPEARGPDDGRGPKLHPRIPGDGGGRIFLNPASKGN